MARGARVRLKGVQRAERRVNRYAGRVVDAGTRREVLAQAAEPLRQAMAAKVPRGSTGTLSSSIVVADETQSSGVRVLVRVGPGKEGFYGLFQEVGTAHHPAQPFMRPARDMSQRAVQAAYHAAMSSAARRLL